MISHPHDTLTPCVEDESNDYSSTARHVHYETFQKEYEMYLSVVFGVMEHAVRLQIPEPFHSYRKARNEHERKYHNFKFLKVICALDVV